MFHFLIHLTFLCCCPATFINFTIIFNFWALKTGIKSKPKSSNHEFEFSKNIVKYLFRNKVDTNFKEFIGKYKVDD